jgi:hypothetical protein
LILSGIIKGLANGFMFDWYSVSETENFSKKKKLYIAKYDIEFVDNLTNQPDSIYTNFIKDLIVWSEYEWHRKPFLIFFHPVQRTDKEVIVIKDIHGFRDTLISKRRRGRVLIKIEGYGYSGTLKDRKYLILKAKDGNVKESINIVAYENNLKTFFRAKLIRRSE